MSNQREPPRTPQQPGRALRDFSPVHVNAYQECPERFYLRHVKHQWTRKTFARPLVIGQATHNALAFVWKQRLEGFEIPDDLPKLASMHLNQSSYPRDEQTNWSEDVDVVASHISRCLAALPSDAAIVSVEREWSYPLQSSSGETPINIQSRVDLVLKRRDGIIQHVDYKTGRHQRDLVQEVMSRVVVQTMLEGRGMAGAPVVTSTLFAKDGAIVSEQLDREHCRPIWISIVESVQGIREATDWRPRPGLYCRWCDFAESHCSLRGEKREAQ